MCGNCLAYMAQRWQKMVGSVERDDQMLQKVGRLGLVETGCSI